MKTLSKIREEGISVLSSKLGPVDAIRFLRQFDNGYGDYTLDRDKILGNPSVEEISQAGKKLSLKRKNVR